MRSLPDVASAFDPVVAEAAARHPKGVAAAYAEIERVLAQHDDRRVQGSLFLTDDQNMARLAVVMLALKALPWFPDTVRDIRAFRVELWSDFTSFVKEP